MEGIEGGEVEGSSQEESIHCVGVKLARLEKYLVYRVAWRKEKEGKGRKRGKEERQRKKKRKAEKVSGKAKVR